MVFSFTIIIMNITRNKSLDWIYDLIEFDFLLSKDFPCSQCLVKLAIWIYLILYNYKRFNLYKFCFVYSTNHSNTGFVSFSSNHWLMYDIVTESQRNGFIINNTVTQWLRFNNVYLLCIKHYKFNGWFYLILNANIIDVPNIVFDSLIIADQEKVYRT